jgi:hypothetical protein
MGRNLISSLLLLVSSIACLAQPSANYAPIVGVWKANQDSLPMMTLTVEDDKGKLTGAVLFFLLKRQPGAAETSTAGTPEPLIDPAFDGHTLSFKVSHSHAHPETKNEPPVAFQFELRPDGKIRFLGPDGKQVEMIRETSY